MISTTASIFCAVLFDQALFAFFVKQILPGDPNKRMHFFWGGNTPIPRGFGIKVGDRERILVGLSVFCVAFFLLNYLCFLHKKGGHGLNWACLCKCFSCNQCSC